VVASVAEYVRYYLDVGLVVEGVAHDVDLANLIFEEDFVEADLIARIKLKSLRHSLLDLVQTHS